MSETTDFWRSVRAFNSHNLVSLYYKETGGLPLWINWQAQESGRLYRSAGFHVSSPIFDTDPTAHFMDRGMRFFMKFGNDDAEQTAKNWATEKYGVTEWVKIAGFPRDWFPKEIADWAKTYRRHAVLDNEKERTNGAR